MDDAAPDTDLATLRDLLDLMREHDLDQIKVKIGDAIYEIARHDPNAAPAMPVAYAAPSANASGGNAAGDRATGETPPPVAGAHVKKVVAPLTGFFYRSSSPDAEPFVNVGDRVGAGDVLCILEAMKLFNEIQSDYTGTISRIVAENGELVSQGAELFWIEP
jgi:acetyl-CoA carboxylase biotin carboxyl carrier protein